MNTLPDTNRNDLQIFNCELGDIRVIIGNNEPLFCLSDLVKVLELTNAGMIKEAIDREFDKGGKFNLYPLDTAGGRQNFIFINEAELYFVLMRSRSDKAKPFRKWVTQEVLPSIRKSGEYKATQAIPKTYAEALLEAGRLALENEKMALQIKEDAPKIQCFNELMNSENAIDFLTFSKVIGIGRTHLFDKCRKLGILMQDNKPFQIFIDRGYFRVIESVYTHGDTTRSYTKTMILPKGQEYLTKKLKRGV